MYDVLLGCRRIEHMHEFVHKCIMIWYENTLRLTKLWETRLYSSPNKYNWHYDTDTTIITFHYSCTIIPIKLKLCFFLSWNRQWVLNINKPASHQKSFSVILAYGNYLKINEQLSFVSIIKEEYVNESVLCPYLHSSFCCEWTKLHRFKYISRKHT